MKLDYFKAGLLINSIQDSAKISIEPLKLNTNYPGHNSNSYI